MRRPSVGKACKSNIYFPWRHAVEHFEGIANQVSDIGETAACKLVNLRQSSCCIDRSWCNTYSNSKSRSFECCQPKMTFQMRSKADNFSAVSLE